MRHEGLRFTLRVLEGCIGVGAIGGGLAILTNAMNFDQWLPAVWLTGTPFSDYTIPGLLLLVVVGGGMLLAAATIFVERAWAVFFSMAMGLILIVFEAFEVAIIDRFAQAVVPSAIVQQILMFGLGLLIFGLASFLWLRGYRQPHTSDKPISPA